MRRYCLLCVLDHWVKIILSAVSKNYEMAIESNSILPKYVYTTATTLSKTVDEQRYECEDKADRGTSSL